jgi:hypothetical protein
MTGLAFEEFGNLHNKLGELSLSKAALFMQHYHLIDSSLIHYFKKLY